MIGVDGTPTGVETVESIRATACSNAGDAMNDRSESVVVTPSVHLASWQSETVETVPTVTAGALMEIVPAPTGWESMMTSEITETAVATAKELKTRMN